LAVKPSYPVLTLSLAAGILLAYKASGAVAETTTTNSATRSESDADAAWKAVQKAASPLAPPGEWQLNRPSPEQVEQFHAVQGAHAAEAAEKAHDFYTRFPKDPKAAEAHNKELELLRISAQLGNTNKIAELEKLEAEKLKDPSLPEDERLSLRVQAVSRKLRDLMKQGNAEALAPEEEKSGRELIKEFPKHSEGYELLAQAARQMDEKKGRAIAEEIVASAAPEEVKQGARGMLKKMEAVGKPVSLRFTSLDKHEVDMGKLKGKVVLVDFWATWCGPCVAELPEVKATYNRLHEKGFEIVGISLDSDQSKLEQFVENEKMAWPQYFDGKGWQNKFAQEFGIDSIPAMWLVDKKGVLREQNARGGLTEKVEKLLAEN
jgi:thiol-disulfide isomerase/thioredoxin